MAERESLNADFTKRAVMDTAKMDWQASPSPTVWRKRLDLIDGEQSRVTSLVRYDAKSRFPVHDHPQGEEIYVLKGVFSDEHGDYGAGTYLLNPPGFRHAPFSRKGCIIFVKLRQYGGDKRQHVVIDTKTAKWAPGRVPGVDILPLYKHVAYPESMELWHFSKGASLPRQDIEGGAEFFVIDGDLQSGQETFAAGGWLRLPPGGDCALRSKKGCTLYVKRGHLKPVIL